MMTERPRIYLDHAATTPVLPEARAAMARALERWANPSSPHAEGRAARAALEDARARIKRALGWDGELIFASGASEAIDIALAGRDEPSILASAVEHSAVLRHVSATRIAVGADGRIVVQDIPQAPGAILVVQHANNETGIVQPIADLRAAAPRLPLLCDCAQTAGKLPLPDADLIAVASHKVGGPPGVGALLVRDPRLLKARGGQEKGYRGGTENLPAIAGFAAALEAQRDWLAKAARLRKRLEARLTAAGAQVAGQEAPRLSTIGAYRMIGVPSEAQLIQFDIAGIAVSAGSACSSGSMKPSHVLRAMGWPEAEAREVVRVSFGPATSEAEVDAFADSWEALARRRAAA